MGTVHKQHATALQTTRSRCALARRPRRHQSTRPPWQVIASPCSSGTSARVRRPCASPAITAKWRELRAAHALNRPRSNAANMLQWFRSKTSELKPLSSAKICANLTAWCPAPFKHLKNGRALIIEQGCLTCCRAESNPEVTHCLDQDSLAPHVPRTCQAQPPTPLKEVRHSLSTPSHYQRWDPDETPTMTPLLVKPKRRVQKSSRMG